MTFIKYELPSAHPEQRPLTIGAPLVESTVGSADRTLVMKLVVGSWNADRTEFTPDVPMHVIEPDGSVTIVDTKPRGTE
jgi:hypothetical protein